MAIEKEETRKGPWNEEEDRQLVCYVGLFGERRWDFIAKVSGLNRTGKSCRLRWVNYLHPGLKRGRMTPQEERIVLQLHARWGNRWSHIARNLPGRTDNEIKNYWRTHMRKIAQEKKRTACPSSSSSSVKTSDPRVEVNAERRELSTISGSSPLKTTGSGDNKEVLKDYSMEQIWNEIEHINEACNMNVPCSPLPSPTWECCPDTVWKMDVEEPKMFPPLGCGFLVPNYQFGREPYG